jgi:CRISPR/Cas system endoribonuclease Cas6 (RAMP superfamily)
MSGLVGSVTCEARAATDWSPFLPLRLAGEWVHVGRGTVMGLGQYRIETLCAGSGFIPESDKGSTLP